MLINFAHPIGLEPMTFCLTNNYSNQLSYRCIFSLYVFKPLLILTRIRISAVPTTTNLLTQRDLNPRPSPYEGAALTICAMGHYRANEGNRTLILCLEGRRTGHCATLAWTGHCDKTAYHPRCCGNGQS